MRGRRRSLLAAGLSLLLASSVLAGCGSDSGAQVIRFTLNKREAIPYMREVIADYEASQDDVRVVLDTSGVDPVSASFVRGNPPDLMMANYNMEVSRFVERCTVSDLSGLDAASQYNPDLQPLLDQYGVCEGQTSAIPYSIMAAGIIYNKDIFEEYGLEVPETWDELIEVCEALQAEGITPIYLTGASADNWTIGQGPFDYAVGGSIDVLQFFEDLEAEGTDVGADSKVSFQKDFAEPVEKMRLLADEYSNQDSLNRSYGDGNTAFANGEAAMYMQGPWAFSEIAKTDPDLNLGTFPLPMTNDPADLKVRVNVDLALMIPNEAANPEAAKEFLEFLYQPDVIAAYNESQLGINPLTGGEQTDDPRIQGALKYYNEAQFYQGPSVLVPKTIPVFNYNQSMLINSDPTASLKTMDEDWVRLAERR
ncbi:ABC transporter substrate-binding protein [Ancrocorticia populi]|uniref:Carbohydrate-binding protein n=1 Tax=Ancrocorticia populi TaxID=2175228 RepID=A0A2V1KAV9_9ACTO|nr:extracellular solute-binding protein [Ancrocorticia populi]PWF26091.1 carbohydrate-binding protein [Ancrocorticia populi]